MRHKKKLDYYTIERDSWQCEKILWGRNKASACEKGKRKRVYFPMEKGNVFVINIKFKKKRELKLLIIDCCVIEVFLVLCIILGLKQVLDVI